MQNWFYRERGNFLFLVGLFIILTVLLILLFVLPSKAQTKSSAHAPAKTLTEAGRYKILNAYRKASESVTAYNSAGCQNLMANRAKQVNEYNDTTKAVLKAEGFPDGSDVSLDLDSDSVTVKTPTTVIEKK